MKHTVRNTFKPYQCDWKNLERKSALRLSKIFPHQIAQYRSTCTCQADFFRKSFWFVNWLDPCQTSESTKMHFFLFIDSKVHLIKHLTWSNCRTHWFIFERLLNCIFWQTCYVERIVRLEESFRFAPTWNRLFKIISFTKLSSRIKRQQVIWYKHISFFMITPCK